MEQQELDRLVNIEVNRFKKEGKEYDEAHIRKQIEEDYPGIESIVEETTSKGTLTKTTLSSDFPTPLPPKS